MNSIIAPALIGKDPLNQEEIDKFMVEQLDGTKTEWGFLKSKLGANSILAVSMAVCRAGAAASHMPLYDYIATLADYPIKPHHLPIPSFNIINGGAHSGNALAFQEFMILPVGASNFREAMRMASEVYQSLKKIIAQRYGTDSVNVGDEGGFAPNITNCESGHACHPAMHSVYTALDLILDAVRASGYEGKVKIALDVAASEFYDRESKRYNLLKKVKGSGEEGKVDAATLLGFYEKLVEEYPIEVIEDGFDEDDFEGWRAMREKLGSRITIVGDDLTVTNILRIENAIEKGCCNALLLKVNQIGSVTEAIQAVRKCREAGQWSVMASHRSGETEDCFLSHLSVGLHTERIKSGAPCRSERLCKYNELMRIEEELLVEKEEVFFGEKKVESYLE